MDRARQESAEMDTSGALARRTAGTSTLAKMLVASAVALASAACAAPAWAQDGASPNAATVPEADHYYAYDPAKASAPSRHHRTFGMSMDVGVPDGAALGVVMRPRFDWLRLGAAVTHNGIAPGVRLGVTIDPIAFPIAPTLTIEGGHSWAGTVPMLQGSPSIGYDYANFHLGIEVGNRASFRFFLRGGASWVDMSSAQAQNTGVAITGIGNPSYTGWLAPSAKLGFALYF
jgi:opacity protein-like surface antigen